MTNRIRVTSTYATSDWRVTFEDSSYICDVHLSISSMLHGSRYHVIQNGKVVKNGTFKFELWDHKTIRETLEAIGRAMYPNAEIVVDMPPKLRAAGT